MFEQRKLVSQFERRLDCRFCSPPEPQRIVYRGEHLYVMVSLGPIVEGYSLLLSKTHIPSCADIPLGLLPEFFQVKEYIRGVLTDVYGACSFYEHGKSGSCLPAGRGEQHCYHAHLHCVPTTMELLEDIAEYFTPIAASEWLVRADLRKDIGEGYFYYENPTGQAFYFAADRPIRSQFLRWVLASRLGKPERANWQVFPDWPTIEAGKQRLLPYFTKLQAGSRGVRGR